MDLVTAVLETIKQLSPIALGAAAGYVLAYNLYRRVLAPLRVRRALKEIHEAFDALEAAIRESGESFSEAEVKLQRLKEEKPTQEELLSLYETGTWLGDRMEGFRQRAQDLASLLKEHEHRFDPSTWKRFDEHTRHLLDFTERGRLLSGTFLKYYEYLGNVSARPRRPETPK